MAMGLLQKLRERLDEDLTEVEAKANRDWCCELGDVTPAAEVTPRSVTRVGGVVQSIKVIPSENTTTLVIRISDGTGEVTAKWLGRSQIKGIRLGSRIVLEGTIAKTDRKLEVLNPAYDLIPSIPTH